MIFDRMDDQMGGRGNMMDWGPNMWFYMILVMVICVLIILIIIYRLSRRTHKDKYSPKEIGEVKHVKSEKPNFCPNCKEKLDDKTLKFCPHCGSEL